MQSRILPSLKELKHLKNSNKTSLALAFKELGFFMVHAVFEEVILENVILHRNFKLSNEEAQFGPREHKINHDIMSYVIIYRASVPFDNTPPSNVASPTI